MFLSHQGDVSSRDLRRITGRCSEPHRETSRLTAGRYPTKRLFEVPSWGRRASSGAVLIYCDGSASTRAACRFDMLRTSMLSRLWRAQQEAGMHRWGVQRGRNVTLRLWFRRCAARGVVEGRRWAATRSSGVTEAAKLSVARSSARLGVVQSGSYPK